MVVELVIMIKSSFENKDLFVNGFEQQNTNT
jgi:hypothetical protein